jgi:Iap family predicted aminopeptidase
MIPSWPWADESLAFWIILKASSDVMVYFNFDRSLRAGLETEGER